MFQLLKTVTYHTMDQNAERNPEYQGENKDEPTMLSARNFPVNSSKQ